MLTKSILQNGSWVTSSSNSESLVMDFSCNYIWGSLISLPDLDKIALVETENCSNSLRENTVPASITLFIRNMQAELHIIWTIIYA